MAYGLSNEDLQKLIEIWEKHPRIENVFLYGSRAKGNFHKASDIDLTLKGNLDYNEQVSIETELDDLLLPYKIDLSLHHHIDNPDLLSHISRVGKNLSKGWSSRVIQG